MLGADNAAATLRATSGTPPIRRRFLPGTPFEPPRAGIRATVLIKVQVERGRLHTKRLGGPLRLLRLDSSQRWPGRTPSARGPLAPHGTLASPGRPPRTLRFSRHRNTKHPTRSTRTRAALQPESPKLHRLNAPAPTPRETRVGRVIAIILTTSRPPDLEELAARRSSFQQLGPEEAADASPLGQRVWWAEAPSSGSRIA